MASKEISLWIDERWYDALNKHLKDETLEEHLENVLDELCNQLPEHEYERISRLIWEEQEEHRMEAEAARRFAVFHVTEQGQSTYFVAEENIDTLQVANRLRLYTRKPPDQEPRTFLGLFTKGERISREQFDTYVCERLENTGRVVGAYDIDLDKGRFDALHITDGWQGFRVQDVSTAAYFAMKKSYAPWGERSYTFLERLDGKQLTDEPRPIYLTGARTLRDGDISFAEDIIQNDHLLEFYMEVCFDVDKVFSTNVPGHAPDGVAYLLKNEACVFVGDILFAGSVGRTDFPGGSMAQLVRGIRTHLLSLDPHTEVFSGHGPSTSIGEELLNNPYIA